MPLADEAVDVLTERGFYSPTGRLDRKKIGSALAAIIEDRHVEEDHAATLDELSVELFGSNHEDLRTIVAQETRPLGSVQTALTDGMVLLPIRVEREVGAADGVPVVRFFSGRYVTANMDEWRKVIEEVQVARVASGMKRIAQVLDICERRNPEFAAYRPAVAELIVGKARAALESGE